MKIYSLGISKNHTVFLQPAIQEPSCNEWREQDGRAKMFSVTFINNEADVDDNLALFMIEHKLAARSKIITSLNEVA